MVTPLFKKLLWILHILSFNASTASILGIVQKTINIIFYSDGRYNEFFTTGNQAQRSRLVRESEANGIMEIKKLPEEKFQYKVTFHGVQGSLTFL